jgi:hypothetical protein
MSDPKDPLNSILDRVDQAMDNMALLRRIGTPEEEEEATRKRPTENSLIEWKMVPSSQKWHAFFLGTDRTRCEMEYSDTLETNPKNLPARAGIICCTLCVLKTTR